MNLRWLYAVRQGQYRMIALTALSGAAIAVTALTATGTAQAVTTAPLAHAAAASGVRTPARAKEKCTYGSSSGNVSTCIRLKFTSSEWQARARAKVRNAGRTLKECIRTPVDKGCTPWVSISKGGELSLLTPVVQGPTPAGEYCATTYRKNAGAPRTQIGKVCVSRSS